MPPTPTAISKPAQYKVIRLAYDSSVATAELEKQEKDGWSEIVAVYTLTAPAGESPFVILRRGA